MEKQFKINAFKIIGILIILFLFAAFTGVIVFSPYGKADGFDYKLIMNTVHINAPVDSVFLFLGNSANASRWSVFVNHIIPLNSDSFQDGGIGSRRRCFCNPDKNGRQWDELITEVIPNKKRQLVIFNLKEFQMTANHLATEQLYAEIQNNECQLIFTVFLKNGQPTLYETIKTYIAAYKIKSIFKENMNNIKRIVETGK